MAASAASENMRVVEGSMDMAGLLFGTAQFGDEIVDVPAVPGLRALDGDTLAVEADALHQEPGVTGLGAQQLGLFFVEDQRAQSLQRPYGPVAGFLERRVKRMFDGILRGQALGQD